MTTDTDLTVLDAEVLHSLSAQGTAAASAAQSELHRRAEERRQTLAERQRAWDADLVRRYPSMEATLVQDAKDQETAFKKAVWSCDMDASLESWIRGRSTRDARQQVRDAARSAEVNAGPQPGVVISDVILTHYPADFMRRVEEEAAAAALALAEATAAHLIGARPTDLEVGS